MRRRVLTLVCGLAACSPGAEVGDTAGAVEPVDPGRSRNTSAPVSFYAVFEDTTAASGIAFVHTTGGFGEKRLPETMGGGATLFDYDGDARLDLFLVNFAPWPDAPDSAGASEAGSSVLYRGAGDGTFTDVSRATGADVRVHGMGAVAGDYDGDGDQDLFVTTLAADLLLDNDEGRFRDRAAQAGVSGAPDPGWSTAALWFDADVDGDLDLFVGGYVEWSPETEIFTTIDGVNKVFTTPDHYPGRPSRLYTNDGSGQFERAPFEEGEPSLGKVLGAIDDDLDGDGLPEVVAANDTRPNFLFHNLGGGRFEETGLQAGLAYDENGRARAGMGIDVARLGGERTVVAIGNFSGEPLSLYERRASGRFAPVAAESGLRQPTFDPLAFGVRFADVDLDGWLDLLVVNGHIEPEIARFDPGASHAQSALVLRGTESGVFVDVSAAAGEALVQPRVARGVAHGDVDGDGDVDLIITQNGGPAVLLSNRLQERHPQHFLRVALRGQGHNPDALGAVVELRSEGRRQVRRVGTGGSYLSQGELVQTFGLGADEAVERLLVRWPGGATTEHEVPEIDRTIEVFESPR